jgi:hypothetical protein
MWVTQVKESLGAWPIVLSQRAQQNKAEATQLDTWRQRKVLKEVT